MKFDFDTYEFAGLIAPGAVIVLAAALFQPGLRSSFDALALIAAAAVASYVIGHLVASIGNLCEPLFSILGAARLENVSFDQWKAEQHAYLSPDQESIVRDLARTKLDGDVLDPSQRPRIVKQMRLAISNGDHLQRLETFNGLYNLSRGLTVAFIVVLLWSLISWHWEAAAFCALAAALTSFRVRKFSNIYSRELVQQFLMLR